MSLLIGFLAGVTSFFSFRHLQCRFEMAWGLLDSSGVLSFAAFPSLFGGIASTIVLVFYEYTGLDSKVRELSNPNGIFQ